MPSLVRRFLRLKNNYRNFDTRDALKRMQAFRCSVRHILGLGRPVALELLGSIAFGITVKDSDTDCILMHFCKEHDDDCPEECSELALIREELVKALGAYMYDDERFHLEILDWINLKCVERVVDSSSVVSSDILNRFMYYRTIGRPVNRPLIVKYSDALECSSEFMDRFDAWASDVMKDYLKTSSHQHSFNKYNERIRGSGLRLPQELQEELGRYLK